MEWVLSTPFPCTIAMLANLLVASEIFDFLIVAFESVPGTPSGSFPADLRLTLPMVHGLFGPNQVRGCHLACAWHEQRLPEDPSRAHGFCRSGTFGDIDAGWGRWG